MADDAVSTPSTPPVASAAAPAAKAPAPAAPVAPKAPVPEVVETYTALVDLQYGDTFVKAGDTTNDVPKNSVKWLLEQKFIIKKEVT
jgi:hypothetical protein